MDLVVLVNGQDRGAMDVIEWGDSQRDALAATAKGFKDRGDMTGVYLCAIVEDEVRKLKDGSKRCSIEMEFFLSLTLSKNVGALHKLVHIIEPQIAGLIADAKYSAGITKLKNEAEIG